MTENSGTILEKIQRQTITSLIIFSTYPKSAQDTIIKQSNSVLESCFYLGVLSSRHKSNITPELLMNYALLFPFVTLEENGAGGVTMVTVDKRPSLDEYLCYIVKGGAPSMDRGMEKAAYDTETAEIESNLLLTGISAGVPAKESNNKRKIEKRAKIVFNTLRLFPDNMVLSHNVTSLTEDTFFNGLTGEMRFIMAGKPSTLTEYVTGKRAFNRDQRRKTV